MKKTFKPQNNILITIIACAYSLALLLFGIVFYSGNQSEALIQAFVIIFGMATLFSIAFAFSKRTLTKQTINIIAMLFIRHTCEISRINSITRLRNYAGFGEAIVIHYLGKYLQREMRIGIGAYGSDQVAEILNILQERNSAIKFDEQSESIMQHKNSRG